MKWEIVRIKIGESNNIIKKIVTNEKILLSLITAAVLLSCQSSRDTSHKYTAITPGVEWLDTNNEKINAHGGGNYITREFTTGMANVKVIPLFPVGNVIVRKPVE